MSKKNNWAGWDFKKIQELKANGQIDFDDSILSPSDPVKEKKKKKFGNVETEVDGIKFDSMKEAKRYKDLLMMLKAGEIGMLRIQVPYKFEKDGKKIGTYLADFVYVETKTGNTIVEDVKSDATRTHMYYRLKKRLMKAFYNIDITEV